MGIAVALAAAREVGAIDVQAGSSGHQVVVTLGNPSPEATIGLAGIEVASAPPWLTGTSVSAAVGLEPGDEVRTVISFGVAASAPADSRGELVLRIATEPGVYPTRSEVRIPLRVLAPSLPPGPPQSQGWVVWLHPDDTTCCPADTGGVPNYAFHGTEADEVRAGAIVLRSFPDHAQMMAWVCSHEIVPHYWAGTYARIAGHHVTRVPCGPGRKADPPPPTPPLPAPSPSLPPAPPERGSGDDGSGGSSWEPPSPSGGTGKKDTSGEEAGWSGPLRQDPPADPCRGPRSERQRALGTLGEALRRQDLDGVVKTLGALAPECPGDADDLARLRDAGVEIARAEADANASRMRSAISRTNAARARSQQAWAAAAGVLRGVLGAIQAGAATGATGGEQTLGGGSGGSGAPSAGSPGTAVAPCYLNIPASVRGLDGQRGVVWYVVTQGTGVSVVPHAQGEASPFTGSGQVDGPYPRLADAERVARARCPSSITSPFG